MFIFYGLGWVGEIMGGGPKKFRVWKWGGHESLKGVAERDKKF